ncbi:MAG TPA: SPOR domain-containing protein [Blastocatellia bacterium]|nr:SPOR domain-containing protein [Blastocatellia bacterium]
MIETILPRRASTPVAHPQYAVSGAGRFDIARPIDFEAKTETQEEDYELISLEPGAEAKKDFLEEAEEVFGRTATPAATISTEASEIFKSPAQVDAFDKNAISQPATEMPVAFKPIDQTHTIEEEIPLVKPMAQSLSYVERTDQSIARSNGSQAETISELKAAIDENAIDPWDDPLPAWEYSRNEWPIIVEAKNKSKFANLKIPIAIGVLAALAIIAYFVLKPPAEEPQGQISIMTPDLSAQPKGTAPAAEAQTPTTAPASEAATTAPAQTTPAQTAASDEGSAKWRYSLQAMASQNEAEAKQFAEKLVRAGVPAYVVSAELGQRKWHRVRVGSFITADEATRFIGEARERAKSAGLALRELNLCAYEKP